MNDFICGFKEAFKGLFDLFDLFELKGVGFACGALLVGFMVTAFIASLIHLCLIIIQ